MPPQTSSSTKSQRSSSKNDSKTKTTSKSVSSSKTSSKSNPATSSKDATKTKTSKQNSSQKSISSTSKSNGKTSSSKKDPEDVAKKNILNDTNSKRKSSSSDKVGKPLPQNAYITGKESTGKSKVSKSSVETTKRSSRKEKEPSSRKEKDLSSRKEKDSSSRKAKDPSSRRELDSLRKEKIPSSKESSRKDRDSSLRKSVRTEGTKEKTGSKDSKERDPKKSRESSKSSSRNSNARSSTKSEKEKTLRSDRQKNTDSKPKEKQHKPKRDETSRDEPTSKPIPLSEALIQKDKDEDSIPEEQIPGEEISREVPEPMTGPEDHLPVVDPSHNSLDTLESGISMTSPINDLSDEGEVEESISSRFVEVDEMDLNEDDPSQISSSAFPDPPSSLPNSSEEKEVDYDVDYEEDFENYESDFEDEADEETEDEGTEEEEESEETSSEDDDEEDAGPDPEMETVLKALEAENNRPQLSQDPTDLTVNTSDANIQEETIPSSTKLNRPKTARAYVNFKKARERAKSDKTSERLKNRGQLLQEMITLDSVYIDLFSQISESYEAYIAAFGSSNRVQVSVQTNEDALSEDVQTDAIVMLEKWTQKPIHIAVNGDQLPTSQDYLGVGGDILAENSDDYNSYKAMSSDSGRLSKFLSASSQVVLTLLEEEAVHDREMSLSSDVDDSLGFSNSGITLGSELEPLLEGRNCTFVKFCPSDPLLLLSGHGFIDSFRSEDNSTSEKEEGDAQDYEMLESGALLCLWLIYQPSFPKRLLACRSPPTVASFSPGRPTVVVAGLNDGSLAAWDLRESSANHTLSFTLGDSKWKLSPPSYITACSMEDAYEGSRIVALEAIERPKEEMVSNYGSFQVVSLSSFGQLTWWVLVQGELRPSKIIDANNPGISTELGASPWSRITLSRTASTSVYKQLQSEDNLDDPNLCYDLKLSECDPNQLYVASANGSVINCSRHEIKMHPPFFVPEIEPGAEAVSLSVCAHEPQYFLVGGSDGLLRLHTSSSSLPLTCWQASINPGPVQKVSWSPSRPCVFYMLDTTGRFHVWDLSAGDIFPVISVDEGRLIGGQLQNFDIAKSVAEGSRALHAAFVSDSGGIIVRTVSPQFLRKSEENYRSELERFKCYVNII